jgi:hypothetical protein
MTLHTDCPRATRYVVAWLVATLPVLATAEVRAQSDTESALAEALYRQARDLMASGKLEEACPKFAESYRLDRATGTLLNLAACYERQGKLASAWLAYSDGVIAARRDGRTDRVKYAEEHLHDLEPKLSRVTLVVPSETDDPALELSLDGAPVGRAARGVPTPVDPGRHVVEAKAPGKEPFSKAIDITAVAQQETVTIPTLRVLPQTSAPPPTALAMPIAPQLPATPTPEAPAERPIPAAVYIAGGTTLALAIAAGVTGVVYLNDRSAFEKARDSGAPDAQDRYDSTHTLGVANAVLWGAAACGAVVTGYFYFTRPKAGSGHAGVRFWATPRHAGLGVGGAF